MSVAGDITAIRDWANSGFYTKEEINNLFLYGLSAIYLREPLYNQMFFNQASPTSVYTAVKACKVLALNMEVIGEANSNTHRTSATITTTGTVVDDLLLESSFNNSAHTRDCTISAKIIQLSVGDTITFSNSSISGYDERLHIIFDMKSTDFTELSQESFLASIDNNTTTRDITIQNDGDYLAFVIDVVPNDSITPDYDSVNVITGSNKLSTGKFKFGASGNNTNAIADFAEIEAAASDTVRMTTTNRTSYVSKIFAIIELS